MDVGTNDDDFELSLSDVRRRLDWLALRSLELCEDILSERGSLDGELSEAYLNMAKSRYNMGKWSVGTSQVPSEEAEIEPLFRVETNKNGNFVEYSLTSSSIEDNLVDYQCIRQRRAKGDPVDNVKEENETEEDKQNSNRKNPLRWFGILVPHSLRQSQDGFQKCLFHLCKIASFQSELKVVCDEYKQLRERTKTDFAMKPVSLLQVDWHTSKEASEIFQSLFQPNKLALRQFGLLERPSVSLHLDQVSYKLFVCGKGGVGKTSLIARLSGNEMPVTYCETPGIQVSVVYWPVKLLHTSRIVMFRLEFWDAGEGALKKFDHILPACKEDMDALIFLFSFTDRSSFEEIPQQLSRIFQPSERPCPIIFGTRYEQHSVSEVTQRDLREFEQRWKIPVIKLKNSFADPLNKTQQTADFNEMGLALNVVCNQLWQRDQALAGIASN